MKQLQQDVRALKDNSTINKASNNPSFKEPKKQSTHSKKAEMASNNNGDQQQNMEIINMIRYKEQTMTTLKSFGEQLKIQLDNNPIGHAINLSKKTFTKGTFHLLNKNLNFSPHLKHTININSTKN